ncbi:NAD(P)/FAD-dependent oxidoreductase [Georgenia sp. TF02-10]|uniref:phytoene desaturase family protein n=1 Tax=Georgenia sp. TF02-10 TaxID=2917725 RepID=UPI001FA78D94|nr:NAD(P)/FAD-dependent oxidoreductase [Georgenia sp. TF02-10]UNX55291.1 NAD(P)/FAD-dependent oxidoreductase [Georgenia sp. TF02-10]
MPREVRDAVVVGAGPNGLAAAVTLARAGLDVLLLEAQPTPGGGSRTVDLGLADGVRHDLCSAVHPLALASPFFAAFDLAARGVRLVVPEVSYVQPLAGRPAAVALRGLDATAERLGPDGRAFRALLGPLVAAPAATVALGLGDHRSVPAEVLSAAGLRAALTFGAGLLEQGTRAGYARFVDDAAPALLTGVAAHTIAPLPSLAAAGTALLLGALAHAPGWPVPVGGSQAISDALLADLRAHGGELRLGQEVTTWRQLPRARAYLFDTTPGALARIWGERMRPAVRRAFTRFRHGNAAAKVDYVLSGPVPWADPAVGAAGTVHVGGTRAEMTAAEQVVGRGQHAERPVVLLSDPAVTVPSREVAGRRPLWTYAHVPAGSPRDVTETVTAQIERFAPGFRDVVVASRCVPAARMAEHNPSYVGGDIAGGAVTFPRLVLGPRAADPYDGGVPGVYLCSQSTVPGPGVHGMGGWHAARRALRHRFGVAAAPDLSPGA